MKIVAYHDGPDRRHVVEVEHEGVTRQVIVRVDEMAWTGLGWFGSPHDAIESIVHRYVAMRAGAGTLRDEEFIDSDEAVDIHWRRK